MLSTLHSSRLISVFFFGLSSFLIQATLGRELLSVLSSNELILGLLLGNWLLLTGLGSYAARLKKSSSDLWYFSCQLWLGIIPFAMLAAVRLLKWPLFQGTEPGLGSSYFFILVLLIPYCVTSGFLIGSLPNILGKNSNGQGPDPVSRVYLLDSIGTMAAGILFSFYLANHFSSFSLVTFAGLSHLLAALLVCPSYKRVWVSAMTCGVFFGVLVFLNGMNFESYTLSKIWPGFTIRQLTPSPYGLITVIENRGELHVYENGSPLGADVLTPFDEEIVHIPLSQVKPPQDLLLISGGFGKVIQELNKYEGTKFDYAELNPSLFKVFKRLALQKPVSQTNFFGNFLEGDPRILLKAKKNAYDVVLSLAPDPTNASFNNFYTTEFFSSVRSSLRSDGIFAFSLKGFENVLTSETQVLISSIYHALSQTFPYVTYFPGSRLIFIASNNSLDQDFQRVAASTNLRLKFLNKAYFDSVLTPDRKKLVEQSFAAPALANRDFHPAAYLIFLKHWLKLNQTSFLFLIAGLLFLIAISSFIVASLPNVPAGIALFTSGFAGLGFETILLFSYQILFGTVFSMLGFIMSLFMGGIAFGILLSRRYSTSNRLVFLGTELLISLLFLAFSYGFLSSPEFLIEKLSLPLVPLLFYLSAGLAGAVIGFQFPLLIRLIFEDTRVTSSKAYAVDFLGGSLGAVVIGAALIPLFGLKETCIALSMVKVSSFCLNALRFYFVKKVDIKIGRIKRDWKPLCFVLAVFFIVSLLTAVEDTKTIIYDFSLSRGYLAVIILSLIVGIIFTVKSSTSDPISRYFSFCLAARWLYFLLLSLVAFLPLIRCYFKIPLLFCHACPRPCVFGQIRPYFVPMAILMNLKQRYWCHRLCPLGTAQIVLGEGTKEKVAVPFQKTFSWIIFVSALFLYFLINSSKDSSELPGIDLYNSLFRNSYVFDLHLFFVVVIIFFLSRIWSRPFCNVLCPIGLFSQLTLNIERRLQKKADSVQASPSTMSKGD